MVGTRHLIRTCLFAALPVGIAGFIYFANQYLLFYGVAGDAVGKAVDLLISTSNDLSTYCAASAAGCAALLMQQKALGRKLAILILLSFLFAAAGVFVGLIIKMGAAVPLSRGQALSGAESAFWKGIYLQFYLLVLALVSAAIALAGIALNTQEKSRLGQ